MSDDLLLGRAGWLSLLQLRNAMANVNGIMIGNPLERHEWPSMQSQAVGIEVGADAKWMAIDN